MSVGKIGPNEIYRQISNDLCLCTWCQIELNSYVLVRSAHERSLAHRSAARARGVELPKPKRVKYSRYGEAEARTAKEKEAPFEVEMPERPPRKLPKPLLKWEPIGDHDWKATVGHNIRVRRLGVEGDDKRFVAYHGHKYIGAEDTLERAQALAEHPELE